MTTKVPSRLNANLDHPVDSPSATPINNLAADREVLLKPIAEVAAELGLLPEELEPYGRYKALAGVHRLSSE